LFDGHAALERHVLTPEIGYPRRQPNLISRPVKKPIESGGRDDSGKQLQQGIADRPGASIFCSKSDQRPRESLGQECLILSRSLLSADEVPPADLFVLPEAAFGAGRKQGQKAVHEKQHFALRHADAAEQGVERHDPILTILGKARQ